MPSFTPTFVVASVVTFAVTAVAAVAVAFVAAIPVALVAAIPVALVSAIPAAFSARGLTAAIAVAGAAADITATGGRTASHITATGR